MGGCKCMFRDCPNSSTKNKGMHFFHYPAKDKDRLDIWILMANKPHLHDFPFQKLKNQNVCEEHFKLNQFMNIKKERLTRFGIPTLLKLNSGITIDLEANDVYTYNWSVNSTIPENMTVVLYEEPSLINVPPPPPIRLNTTETAPSAMVHNFQFKISEKITDTDFHIEETEHESTYDFVANEKDSEEATNNQNELTVKLVAVEDQVVVTPMTPVKRKISALDIEKADVQYLYPVQMKKIKTVKKLQPQLETNVEPEESPELLKIESPAKQLLEVNQTDQIMEPTVNNEELQSLIKTLCNTGVQVSLQTIEEEKLRKNEILLKSRYEEEIRLTNVSHQLEVNRYLQQIRQLQGEVQTLKAKLSQRTETSDSAAQTDPLPETKPVVISPKKTPVAPAPKQPVPSTSLTKPQLFNSVKRYLSNTMTTLLKMEIFGGGDREWKPDEKKLSCEIMNLGENIYTYFVDEWRLRLPPRSKVDQWVHESVEEDEDI